jgi:antitoxin (DNA-binding transcriptional repressor) of toxin-antitoxin stability system
MILVSIDELPTSLEKLVRTVKEGNEVVVITDDGMPVAQLTPIPHAETKREFGALKGQFSIGPEFFDPLPAEELAAWEG